jgi:hypothetical protein
MIFMSLDLLAKGCCEYPLAGAVVAGVACWVRGRGERQVGLRACTQKSSYFMCISTQNGCEGRGKDVYLIYIDVYI